MEYASTQFFVKDQKQKSQFFKKIHQSYILSFDTSTYDRKLRPSHFLSSEVYDFIKWFLNVWIKKDKLKNDINYSKTNMNILKLIIDSEDIYSMSKYDWFCLWKMLRTPKQYSSLISEPATISQSLSVVHDRDHTK